MKHSRKIILFVTLLMVLSLVSCASYTSSNSGSDNNVTSSTSAVSTDVSAITTCSHVKYSLACESIVRRYQYLNDRNKYGYFYGLVQGSQTPVIEYVVQGSVFPVDDIVNNPNYQEQCTGYVGNNGCAVVLDKQQPDGTFGTNGNALFGWTASGSYFEWSGPYAYSQTPLQFTGQPVEGCKSGIPGCK